MHPESQEKIHDGKKTKATISRNVNGHIGDIVGKIKGIQNDTNGINNTGIFGNKSLNLMTLERNGFLVPKTIFLSTDFFKNDQLEFDIGFINFPKPWIVRSSCLEEDNFLESNAGRYKMFSTKLDR